MMERGVVQVKNEELWSNFHEKGNPTHVEETVKSNVVHKWQTLNYFTINLAASKYRLQSFFFWSFSVFFRPWLGTAPNSVSDFRFFLCHPNILP